MAEIACGIEDCGEAEVGIEGISVDCNPYQDHNKNLGDNDNDYPVEEQMQNDYDEESMEDVCPEVIIVELDAEDCGVVSSNDGSNENFVTTENSSNLDTGNNISAEVTQAHLSAVQQKPVVVLQTDGGEPILISRSELEKEFKQCPECGMSCSSAWKEIPGKDLTISYKCIAGHCGHTVNLHKLRFMKGLMDAGKT